MAMVLPVAQRVREFGLARPVVLALTTAETHSRNAGLETVGFSDFTLPEDAAALAHGAELAAGLSPPPFNAVESAAYLGLSYSDLVMQKGLQRATKAYETFGRQCFYPLQTMRRILKAIKPALVVATNSPRAEQAAIVAAGELGIPAVCLVDLFAVDEKQWIGKQSFANKVCVLNENVRQMFIREGRSPSEIVATGNPAFDGLLDPVHRQSAATLRSRLVPDQKKLVLYAPSPEPERHPYREQFGNKRLPHEILAMLLNWTASRDDTRLAVRPHPSQRGEFSFGSTVPATIDAQEYPLESLLHACDAVCISISTVGLQAHLVGKPVVQVSGSIFDDAAPFASLGMATEATLLNLGNILDDVLIKPSARPLISQAATPKIIDVLVETATSYRGAR